MKIGNVEQARMDLEVALPLFQVTFYIGVSKKKNTL